MSTAAVQPATASNVSSTVPFEQGKKNKLRETANWTGRLITLPTGVIAGVSGIASFLATHTSFGENAHLDNLANISSRLGYLSHGLGGILTNIDAKNIFGTLGYGFGLAVTPFAPEELIYPLSGFTSALDTLPLTTEILGKKETIGSKKGLLTNVRNKVSEHFNPGNKDPNFELASFEGWTDGAKKTTISSWLSIKDIVSGFDLSNPSKSIKDLAQRPDFNLISSISGMLLSFVFLCLTPFKDLGKGLRDLFGFQSDIAVWQGGLNGTIDKPKEGMKFNEAGELRKFGDDLYKYSGPPYTLGTAIDMVFRFTGMEKLHKAALGIDRFGAALMTAGNIFHDAGKNEAAKYSHNYYTAA